MSVGQLGVDAISCQAAGGGGFEKAKVTTMPQKIPMQVRPNDYSRKVLKFGDLITAAYDSCGKAANGTLRLAVNTHLIVFQGRQRFLIVH